MAASPPNSRTIDAASVRAGRAARMVQQPAETLDYGMDFTNLLPTGATGFASVSVTIPPAVGTSAASAQLSGNMIVLYVDSTGISSGVSGVVTVKASAKDGANVTCFLIAEFTLSIRDQ